MTPASLDPSRAKLLNNAHSALIATGSSLYSLQFRYPEDNKESNVSYEFGRANVSAPLSLSVNQSTIFTNHSSNNSASEIQSIDCIELNNGSIRAVTVDAQGNTILVRGDSSCVDDYHPSLIRRSSPLVEDGPTSVSFSSDGDHIALSLYMEKSLHVIDSNTSKVIRSFGTLHHPSRCAFFQPYAISDRLLISTESNALGLYDLRLSESENGGRVAVLVDKHGPISAIDTHSSGLIAIGGEERAIGVYDIRRLPNPNGAYAATNGYHMKAVGIEWKNALKYEVTAVKFSRVDPRFLYVVGLDHEIYSSVWTTEGMEESDQLSAARQSVLDRRGWRGNGRWCGIDVSAIDSNTNDCLLGITDNGDLCLLKEVFKLSSVQQINNNFDYRAYQLMSINNKKNTQQIKRENKRQKISAEPSAAESDANAINT